MAEALSQAIAKILEGFDTRGTTKLDFIDKMFIAELAEIRIKIEMKLYNVIDKYSFTFTPAQAFALGALHSDYVYDKTSYLGNKLMMMANEIDQQFS